MNVNAIKPPLKFPGSKWNLAEWIVAHMPAHRLYVEPFFGSGAVLFKKPPAKVEILNDLDGRVVNLFRVIREKPDELAVAIEMTPWSRDEYFAAYEVSPDPVEDARRFLVRCWQAFGTKIVHRTGWRADAPESSGTVRTAVWNRLPERILAAAKRLKPCYIENRPAVEVIRRYEREEAVIYCDPPYLLSTRSCPYYACEMTDEEHVELLQTLIEHPGPVLLSGYESEMYREMLSDWNTTRRTVCAEKGRIREEVLWLNPVADEALHGRLFNDWQ